MAFIIKCKDAIPDKDGTLRLKVGRDGSSAPQVNSVAYIWTAETKGGVGLFARGQIVSFQGGGRKDGYEINVHPDGMPVVHPLRNQDLEPYRNSEDATPLVTLARRLYGHSMSKITKLDQIEEVYLANRFTCDQKSGQGRVPLVRDACAFEQGRTYTRADVQDLLDVADEKRGGDWDTGYHRHDGAIYVFCSVGTAGRTGHDYQNRWEGDRLIWFGKRGSRLGQSLVRDLTGGVITVHVFWREQDRSPFMYAGVGRPEAIFDTSPVEVHWSFPKGMGGLRAAATDDELEGELARMALMIHQRIKKSGQVGATLSPQRTGPNLSALNTSLKESWDRQRGLCALCDRPIPLAPKNHLLQMSPDRIDSQNKSYEAKNLHIAHLGCNLAKSDALLEHWREFLAVLRGPTFEGGDS